MINLQISALREGYNSGKFSIEDVVSYTLEQSELAPGEIWIYRLSYAEIEPYIRRLATEESKAKPLYGVPFVIKDNIDLAGIPTTAGCPDFSYIPENNAYVVEKLISAGAIPLGKTNMDQFATGLVGTRSPYGACPNSFAGEYISGGSSSGSAVAVALGCCSFALGTDTAGSGRVPAAFNNLVGLKPTKGLVSNSGVVPACRSLDCVSVFTLDTFDSVAVFEVINSYDASDCYSRKLEQKQPLSESWSFGVPADGQFEFFGNTEYREAFAESVAILERCGGRKVEVDFQPFIAAANLLYSGPWVNERYVAVGEFIRNNPESVLGTTKNIIQSGLDITAPEVFQAMYKIQEYKKITDAVMAEVDVLVTPTAGSYYTIAEVMENPVALNTNLGYYTNYMNLLDYTAVAVPAVLTGKIPFGITVVAEAGSDMMLLDIAGRVHQEAGITVGTGKGKPLKAEVSPKEDSVSLAVCGAHLQGFPLHYQLEELGATLLESSYTAPEYKMYALTTGGVAKPGLIHVKAGARVYVEIYRLSYEAFGKFVNMIPAPLGIGKVLLEGDNWVAGFIGEAEIAEYGEDISAIADWRKYTP